VTQRIFTFSLSEDIARRLDAAAGVAGLSVEDFVVRLVEQRVASDGMREDPVVFQSVHSESEQETTRRNYAVSLDATVADRLEQTACDADHDVEAFLIDLISCWVVDVRTDAARTWQREQAKIALAEYDRTGVSYSLEEAFAILDQKRASLAATLD
jgi:hypothetical protein